MPEAPTTISELPSYGSVLSTDRIPVDRLGAAVTAGAFVVDQAYQIVTVGSTSFTAIGAASNTVGVYFVATGAGSGSGTAAPINTGDAPLSAVAALLGGDPAGTAAAAVAAHEAAADPHPTYSTAAELAVAVAAHAAAADPHPTYTTAAELAAAIASASSQTQTVTVTVRNNSGSTIAKGAPVYVTGSSGTTITIAPADASAEATAAETLGLTTASIANNTDGTVIAVGLLDGLNTAALTEGQIVWLSETTGALTTTRPTQPAHGVVCGYCVKQGSGTSGILYVKVDNGLELAELHDVLVTGAIAGQFLQLAADGLWKPRTFAASDISNSTAPGRALLTAANTTAQRNALELGTTAAPQFSRLGLGVEAVTDLKLAVGGAVVQLRQTVTASSGTYTLDITSSNEFLTAAAIAGAITINLGNLASLPSGYSWTAKLRFSYTSGTITWFSGNTGYTVKWDGGSAPQLNAGDQETVVIEVVGGSSIIEVIAQRGRA